MCVCVCVCVWSEEASALIHWSSRTWPDRLLNHNTTFITDCTCDLIQSPLLHTVKTQYQIIFSHTHTHTHCLRAVEMCTEKPGILSVPEVLAVAHCHTLYYIGQLTVMNKLRPIKYCQIVITHISQSVVYKIMCLPFHQLTGST